MRANIRNIWMGGEEELLTRIFDNFLKTPGLHPHLDMWYKIAMGEPLLMLYDMWDEAKKNMELARNYIETMMPLYNVYVGEDVSHELIGVDLFYNDLDELCQAVDMWLQAGQLSQNQNALAQSSASYYRNNGGVNPGAMNVLRGWYELLQVVTDQKRIIRCIAPDCNKLLMFTSDTELLSGTSDGFHNMACKVAHTEGAQDEVLNLQQLPGSQQVQEAVAQPGVISSVGISGGPNVEDTENTPEG